MSRINSLVVLIIMSAFPTIPTSAQSLEKRHQIELRIGGWSQVTDTRTEIGPGGVAATVASTGFTGGVAYGHWLKEELALRISAGIMAANIDVQVAVPEIATEVAVVAPVLFGVRYYVPKSTYREQFRPFVGGGLGTFIGSQTSTRTGVSVVAEARSEAALGGELEAGIDIVLDRYVLATVTAAYNVMTDFSEPIGGSRNYSGPQMTFGISLLLGKGKNQP